jgi:hypothetical protein
VTVEAGFSDQDPDWWGRSHRGLSIAGVRDSWHPEQHGFCA